MDFQSGRPRVLSLVELFEQPIVKDITGNTQDSGYEADIYEQATYRLDIHDVLTFAIAGNSPPPISVEPIRVGRCFCRTFPDFCPRLAIPRCRYRRRGAWHDGCPRDRAA